MSRELVLRAAGACDQQGIAGTAGVQVCLHGELPSWRRVFATPYADYRRLDALGKAILLAVEAAGLRDALDADDRASTALLLATLHGCLDTDLRFARSLDAAGGVEASLFPFTLPSTALGAVALRHGIGGPTACLGLDPREPGRALQVAAGYVHGGEATACLLCWADWVPAESARQVDVAPRTRAVALLLAFGHPLPLPLPSLAELERSADPAELVIEALRARSSRG